MFDTWLCVVFGGQHHYRQVMWPWVFFPAKVKKIEKCFCHNLKRIVCGPNSVAFHDYSIRKMSKHKIAHVHTTGIYDDKFKWSMELLQLSENF
jgi:hypothetical protein